MIANLRHKDQGMQNLVALFNKIYQDVYIISIYDRQNYVNSITVIKLTNFAEEITIKQMANKEEMKDLDARLEALRRFL